MITENRVKMAYRTETKWAKRTEYDNGITVTRYTWKKRAWDLVLKASGAVMMYGLGRLVGEGMDHIPHINEWIPQAVDYVSGINVYGNLDGLVGLLGVISGFNKSGIRLGEKTLEAKKIVATPFSLTENFD